MNVILRGKAWVFGDNVDTDLIYHNKYLAETDPKQMSQYSFEYYPGMGNFAKEVTPGDFVVAGKNFGCGSSREHAVYCLKYSGVPALLVETCSPIYYRNAINNGYPVLFVKGISDAIKTGKISTGDELEVNLFTGQVKDLTNGESFNGDAVSSIEKDIMAAGGLIEYLKCDTAKKPEKAQR